MIGDRALAWNERVLCSVRGFHVGLGLYLVVLFAFKAYLFPGSSEDDAEQLFYAQTLAWGYKPTQPPLYTWLVLASQQVFGVSVAAVAFVKFALLYLLYALIYRSAAIVLGDRRLAVLAALSLLGIYYLAWDSVLNFSHTVLVAAMCVFTLLAVLRLDHRDGLADYGLLGIAIGLGLISKYNFGLFLIPLAVACLSQPDLRTKLFSNKGLLALALAAAVAGPHFFWALTEPGGFAAVSHKNIVPVDHVERSYFEGAAAGTLDAAWGIVNFVSPLIVLYLVFFPRAFRPLGTTDTASARHRRLFEVMFLTFAALLLLGIVLFQITAVRNHWMVVLVPFPIYMMARVQATAPAPGRLRGFAGLMAVLAVAVAVGVLGRYTTGPGYCRKCNFFIAYADLASELRQAGFQGGTIVSYDYPNQVGGNLRAHFPDSRVASWRYRPFTGPARDGGGTCLLIWPRGFPHLPDGRDEMSRLATTLFGTRYTGDEPVRAIDAAIAGSAGRTIPLAYMLATDEHGTCR